MPSPKPLPRHDDYAWARCPCGHLVYQDDVLGDSCRFCDCTDHRPAVAA